ncbi:MAG: integration host factor subunit beta [Flavobacteriales bacterium TMED288]|nr:integration host factor subunit beta [Flavobacteriales bacterium]RPG53529.1 MAG: integration host factor subunit beta [Flavobacteriales bacterium TMED288]|tara:strand:+ start:3578 stop:3859 length:282 start_codon:yes stop_codon:yes gene_type:complete
MTKAEIISRISFKTGLEKIDVKLALDSMMSEIKSTLKSGENVYFRGFGSFNIKYRAEKTGRNISKNTTIIIPAHKVPVFKPSKKFIDIIKKNN